MDVHANDLVHHSVDEIGRGIAHSESGARYVCLVCGCGFEKGRIYTMEGGMYDAEKAASVHVEMEHGGMLPALLQMEKRDHGLTDGQKDMIDHFVAGRTDAEIATATQLSRSTVRNYRFALRERAKQAKIFLAIWNLVDRETPPGERLVRFPASTTMQDDRVRITEKENRAIIEACFDKTRQRLLHFPRKQKKKAAILRHIVQRFDRDKRYSEPEVNELLKAVYADFVTIRRYLIDYGFLDREKDGSWYWVKRPADRSVRGDSEPT